MSSDFELETPALREITYTNTELSVTFKEENNNAKMSSSSELGNDALHHNFNAESELPSIDKEGVRKLPYKVRQYFVPEQFLTTELLRSMFSCAENVPELELYLEHLRLRYPEWMDDNAYLVNRLYVSAVHALSNGSRMYQEIDQSQLYGMATRFVHTANEKEFKHGKVHMRRLAVPEIHESTRDHKNLSSNEFWKVPLVKALQRVYVQKPTPENWTPLWGQRWISSLAWRVKPPGSWPANYRALGNGSARFLFLCEDSNIKRSVLISHLQNARVYWGCMDSTSLRTPSRATLFDYIAPHIPNRSLTWGTEEITSQDQMSLFESFFKRDKPVFRTAMRYLAGDADINLSLLQTCIDRVFEKTNSYRVQSGYLSDDELDRDLRQVMSRVSTSSEEEKEDELPVSIQPSSFDELQKALELVASTCKVNANEILHFFALVNAIVRCTTNDQIWSTLLLWTTGSENVRNFVRKASEMRYQHQILSADDFHKAISYGGLMAMSCMVPFTSNMYESIVNQCGRLWTSTLRVATEQAALRVVSYFTKILKRVKLALQLGSLAPLFDEGVDPTSWIVEASAVTNYSSELVCNDVNLEAGKSRIPELRKAGLIPDYWVSPVTDIEFANRVTAIYQRGKEILNIFHGDVMVSREITRELQLLRSFMAASSNSYLVMSYRVAPLGVLFDGPPGSGKTVLMQMTMKAIGRANGYDVSSNSIYTWQAEDNFQSGLTASQWGIVADDVDINAAGPQRGVTDHSQIPMKVVNNKPFPVEQASAELKGKICARPLAFMYATNFENCRLQGFSMMPVAFWRRLPIRVNVLAKSQYSQGNGILDPQLAQNCPDGELYDLEVSVFDPAMAKDPADHTVIPYRLVGKMSRSEFFKFIVQSYAKHMAQQQKLLRKYNDNNGWCPSCFAEFDFDTGCTCSDEVIASSYESQMKLPLLVAGAGVAVSYVLTRRALTYASGVIEQIQYDVGCMRDSIVDATSKASALMRDVRRVQRRIDMFKERWRVLTARILDPKLLALIAALLVGCRLTYTWYETQGRENNSSGVVPFAWKRADQTFTPGVPFAGATFTLDDVLAQLKQVFVQLIIPETKGTMWGVLVGSNTVLTPRHLERFAVKDTRGRWQLMVVQDGVTSTTEMWEGNISAWPGNADLMMLRIPHLVAKPSILAKIWEERDTSISAFDSVIMFNPKKTLQSSKCMVKRVAGAFSLLSDLPTENGDCGSIYVTKYGNAWRITAMHAGMFSTTTLVGAYNQAHGIIITSQEVKRQIARLGSLPQGGIIPDSQFTLTGKPEFTAYPAKSEMWSAKTHFGIEFIPIGTLSKPMHNASPNSEVYRPLFADDFEDLEVEFCGRPDYWQKPVFKGVMIRDGPEDTGKWVSPYTMSLLGVERKTIHEDFWWLAIADYIHIFPLLLCDGFRAISEEEALVGIPNSVIHGVDLNTSVGPPFNKAKKHHMVRIYSEKETEAYVDENVWLVFDDLKPIDENYRIPVCLGLLKDEPVKYTKNEQHKIRVFNCLPFGKNLNDKMRLAGITAFMRANQLACECMVGINMTSSECNIVVEHLKKVDPSLTRILSKDFAAQDKCMNGQQLDGVASVMYAIAKVIRTDPEAAWCAIEALKNCVLVYKNDCIQQGAQNVSGNDKTVEINSISNSCTQRYIYFRQKYGDSLPNDLCEALKEWIETFLEDPFKMKDVLLEALTFREDNALATYGDDGLQAVSDRCVYDPSLDSPLAKEVGYVLTDGNKNDTIVFNTLDDVDFLKRSFVWNEEIQGYIAPLNKKTLAKMLRLAKRSSLGVVDHSATIATDVLRESVYHGKEFYEYMQKRLNDCALKYGFSDNNYYYSPPFELYWQKVVSGDFQTWRVEPEYVEQMSNPPGIGNASVGGKDEGVSVNKIDFDALPEVPHPSSANDVLGTANMSLATPNIEAGAPTITGGLPRLPEMPLGEFLQRGAQIVQYALLPADVQFGLKGTFDPWVLFLANTAVAAKCKNFTYIRGSMRLRFVTTAPAGAYGMYVVSAVPNGGVASSGYAIANTQPVETALQPIHALIDMGESSNVILDLPFVWSDDYMTLDSPTGMWAVNVWTFSAIKNGQGTVPLNATVTVYASLLEDMELVIPRYQIKHPNNFLRSMPKSKEGINDKVKKLTGGMKASEVANSVAGIAAKASAVPILAPFAGPIGAVASGVGSVLSMFGFTRETSPNAPMPVVQRPFSNVANIDCDDTGEIAALSQGNTISFDPVLSGTHSDIDVADLNYLFSKWTLVKALSWTSSAASGAVLTTIPVTPFYGRYTTATQSVNLTVGGFVGLPFSFHRGGMEYLVVIPVSKFHRGVLQFVWTPDGVAAVDLTNIAFNAIIDVEAGKDHIFEVGYANNKPCLANDIITDTFPTIIPYGTASNGRITVRVINPLSAQTESTSVDVLIFARCAPDMQFGVPKLFERWYNPTDITAAPLMRPFTFTYSMQIGALGDEQGEVERLVIVPTTEKYPTKEVLWGEDFKSVRAFMQKFSQLPYLSNAFRLSNYATVFNSHTQPPPCLNQYATCYPYGDPLQYNFNWAGWYGMLFCGVAYSVRYKVVPVNNAGEWSDATKPIPTTFSFGASSIAPQTLAFVDNYFGRSIIPSTVSPTYSAKIGEGVEITVPYYGMKKFELPRDVTNLSGLNPGFRKIDVLNLMPDNGNWSLYQDWDIAKAVVYVAAGPDIRLNQFRFVPRITYSSPTPGNSIPWG